VADDAPATDAHAAIGEHPAPGRSGGYAPSLLLGLLGAVGMTVGVARPWAAATAHQRGVPPIEASVTGADLVPLAGALGVVVLAAFGAVIATRGWVRRGLGVLIAIASVVVLVCALHPAGAGQALEEGLSNKGWTGGDYTTSTPAWRWVVLAASFVCAFAGAAVARLGGRWSTMGKEYDVPATTQRPQDSTAASGDAMSEAEVWREIDQGRDPTQTG
jgi:uncharacterized membrane protein (TIGR02234 family)